jgi:chromosome segregation ATPase
MKEMIEKMSTPVIGSCRSDAQVFVKELKETVELLKEELHFEKEKNAMLVTKAMELEREKNCYLNTSSCDSITNSLRQSQSQWDREQMHKIQETLKKTIMELQEELTSKEQELADARERIAREKARVREFEKEFETKEKEIQLEKQQNLFLTKKLHENEIQLVNEKQNIDLMEQKLQEEKHLREAFQQQVDTLNEVNDALEKRSETLVRRLELNHSIVQECQELKIQLREAEIDQETLVRTVSSI